MPCCKKIYFANDHVAANLMHKSRYNKECRQSKNWFNIAFSHEEVLRVYFIMTKIVATV
jgi:hypothetical protein